MHFVGITTAKSMIMRVLPEWARHLGLPHCRIRGIDLALHDESARYREVVSFIMSDPFSLGALVTGHKIDLLRACRDLFDDLDDFAFLVGEPYAMAPYWNRRRISALTWSSTATVVAAAIRTR
jgi:shikimate 5-dehydrogenase